MFAIIGILAVFGAVVGGYLMEKGNLVLLFQPAELVILLGAAVGTILISNPLHILKKLIGGVIGVFKGSSFNQKRYLDSLKMLYDLLQSARGDGVPPLEADFEKPAESKIFSAFPDILKNHHHLDFICDTLRTASLG